MAPRERPLMLLCDLEGVLLDIPGEEELHRGALEEALHELTGLEVAVSGDRAGHTDYTLLELALADAGLSGVLTSGLFEQLAGAAAFIYARESDEDLSPYLRPGVWATLCDLAAEPWVKVVPCCGALPGIAEVLIERSGLGQPLAVGYGSFARHGATRPDLIEAARDRAGGVVGLPWPKTHTVVASRCQPDVIAALSAGVRTISVGPDVQRGIADRHVELFEDLPHELFALR